MVNQYSFNLDAPQDYLVHGKLGAHYSKNWTKEKQNAYNKWYYKTHKDELAKKEQSTRLIMFSADIEQPMKAIKKHLLAKMMKLLSTIFRGIKMG